MSVRVWGVAVGVVALGVAVVVAVAVFVFGGGEPSLDEAMRRLAGKPGVESVQRVSIVRPVIPADFIRPALLAMPEGYYKGPEPLPLVLSLHGYGSDFMEQDAYFGLSDLMGEYDFALLLANGTRDDKGNRFWNATDLCCGVSERKPDDAGYLRALVEAASEYVTVERVFVVGMSNGGFMAYRLACDGMPGLAGAETWVFRYGLGRCPGGVSVEFWEMRGSGHVPEFSGGGWVAGDGVDVGARQS